MSENIFEKHSYWQSLSPFDWVWGLLMVLGGGYAWQQYSSLMDVYEAGILLVTGCWRAENFTHFTR